jgi:hypothetical protein
MPWTLGERDERFPGSEPRRRLVAFGTETLKLISQLIDGDRLLHRNREAAKTQRLAASGGRKP